MHRTTTRERKWPRLLLEGLKARAAIELDRAKAHYLQNVMRLKVGDQIRLFNGDDGEWLASINEIGRKSFKLQITEQLRPPKDEPGPTLLFAAIKKARMEMLIEKATELGAKRLMPIKTRRSIVDRINLQRLQAIAIEAAEQCERLTVPEIVDLQSLEQALAGWPTDHPLYAADETGGGSPLLEALEPERPAAFLVGPEGGFDPIELDRLARISAVVKVDLGPRILRAETAGITMLAGWAFKTLSKHA